MKPLAPWRTLATRRLASTPIFELDAHERVSGETGRTGEFYVLRGADWVNVVAITPDDEVVLVEQYRHGVERTTLEIPGGVIDPTDASPEAAARRELREETGYEADHWLEIGVVDPNPAIQANRCTTFLATGARRVGEPTPDGTEELRVVVVAASELRELVREGRIAHALVVAALYFWEAAVLPSPER